MSNRDFVVARSSAIAAPPARIHALIDDPETRLKSAVDALTRLIAETENPQRTMLRLSLDPDAGPADLPLRKGRAIGWFEDALSPLLGESSAAEVHRLARLADRHRGPESTGGRGAHAVVGDGDVSLRARGGARATLD